MLIVSILHDTLCRQGYQWLTTCYVNSDDFNKRAEQFKEEMNKVNLFFIKSKTKATLKGDENILLSERIGKIQSNRLAQLAENLAPYQEQNIVMEELYKKKHQQYMISLALDEEEKILRKSREVKEKKLRLQDLTKRKKKKVLEETGKKSKVELIKLKNKKSREGEKKKDITANPIIVKNLTFDSKGFSNPNSTSIPSRNSAATTAASLMMSSQLQSAKKPTIPTTTYNRFSKSEDIELKRKEHEAKIFSSSPIKSDAHFIRDFDDDGKDIGQDVNQVDQEDDDHDDHSQTWKKSK
jgi:hypothetical protein